MAPSDPTDGGAPPRYLKSWTDRIKNFTPSWFSVTMGTGVVPLLFLNFPWQSPVLRFFAFVFWGLNVGLFSFFLVLSFLRYYWYPALFRLMLQHSQQSPFLGTFPMGFATIISGTALLFEGHPGTAWVCYGLWWVDVALSLLTAIGLVFFMMVAHSHKLETTTAVLLLPMVPLTVAAATATSFVSALPAADQSTVLTLSFLLWASGMIFSFTVLAIYFQRLLAHSLPPRAVIISCFLPVGALGQGAYVIIRLGTLFALTAGIAPGGAADAIVWAARISCLFLLSGATFYLITAVAAVVLIFPREFNIGFWGTTFPLGVYALAAMALGQEWDVPAFKGLGAAVAVCEVLCWAGCAVGTAWKGFYWGEMFYSPCLANWIPSGPPENASDRSLHESGFEMEDP